MQVAGAELCPVWPAHPARPQAFSARADSVSAFALDLSKPVL